MGIVNLPGQFDMHLVSCKAGPEQKLPPFKGDGLLQALERLLVPRPQ